MTENLDIMKAILVSHRPHPKYDKSDMLDMARKSLEDLEGWKENTSMDDPMLQQEAKHPRLECLHKQVIAIIRLLTLPMSIEVELSTRGTGKTVLLV